MTANDRADRIYGFTKFVAALLGAVVLFAFCVLYFWPSRTRQLFAWPIQPPLTAMFMGASYANGVIFFAAVLTGKRWHRVWAPHVGVFAFATLLLIATVIHWDKFTHNHPVFWIWVFIYIVAPILTPIALWRNSPEDPRIAEEVDATVPLPLRVIWLIPGVIFLVVALYAFINPTWLIPLWPWKASPLTMRVIVSFYSMLGVAVITVLREPRWSAWRIGATGVTAWHVLVVVAAIVRQQDLKRGLFQPWFYCEIALVIGSVITFAVMEMRKKRLPLP